MRVLFLARSLERGGAERQLAALSAGLARRNHAVAATVFYAGGPLEAEMAAAGVPVFGLSKTGRWDVAGPIARLIHTIRRFRPDIVHGYLPVANLLTLLGRTARPSPHVVWGVRASVMNLAYYDRLSGLAYRLERLAARLPNLIVVNSNAGLAHIRALGYPADRLRLVANGIDTVQFRPQLDAGQRLRSMHGIGPADLLVGLVARLDPMKDHPVFLEAAARLHRRRPGTFFACVGDGPAAYRRGLADQAAALGIADRILWLGGRDDMPAVYSALDLACLTSTGEGFPNVVAEAMACGVSCAVTEVGDAAAIVGELGAVVPPRQPGALAEAMDALLERRRRDDHALSKAVRDRICRHFSLDTMVTRSEGLFQALVQGAVLPD